MADDKTTKTPEQPVTDSGPGKETPPAPQKEPEKVSVSPEPEKKTEPKVKTPQVSVYNFAEIMKEKKAEERAAAPGVEKPDPAKTEKPEKQPEAPKKAEEKPKEPEQPKRRGRPPKADKDKAAAPKSKAPAQKPEKTVKKEPEKKTAPTVQTAPTPKEPEKPQDAPRRGKEQIVYIKLNELHAFKNHPFEVRDDEEMRAMVSSVKDKGVTYIWVLSKNKRPERKGKIQLIDASTFFKKLRKALGDKKNEISPEDRSAVTQLYADFAENEYCKIYDNEEFIYREYTVMQPLQRSYAITEERMEAMLSKGALSSLYDQAKVDELENAEELTGKDQKKLEAYQNNQPVYEAIVSALKASVSEQVYNTPAAFLPVLTKALSSVTADKKLIEKIADGLSVMDKNAEIQRDRKGNIIYDKETKDTELVKWEESIEDYMAREVLPHIPDAAAFFEEDLGKKKPVIKTGAEIPFTRYFYKYQPSTPSEELETRFKELELSVTERVAKLFG